MRLVQGFQPTDGTITSVSTFAFYFSARMRQVLQEAEEDSDVFIEAELVRANLLNSSSIETVVFAFSDPKDDAGSVIKAFQTRVLDDILQELMHTSPKPPKVRYLFSSGNPEKDCGQPECHGKLLVESLPDGRTLGKSVEFTIVTIQRPCLLKLCRY